MTTRYLEIDSTYRNRNDAETLGPSSFAVNIARQTSRTDAANADDSISEYSNLASWRRANFTLQPADTPSTSATRVATYGIQLKPVTVELPDGTFGVSGHGDELHLTSMLSNSSAYNGLLQPSDNYYWGCNLAVSNKAGAVIVNVRIVDYKYVGMNECHVKIDGSVTMDFDYTVDIMDPTHAHDEDVTAVSRVSGWEFVPGGPPYKSYVGAYLYHFDQGTTSHSKARIMHHDKDRNTIQLDPAVGFSVGESDELHIRGLLFDGSSTLFNKSLFGRFGGSAMSGATPDTKSVFGIEYEESIDNVNVGDYLEITKPTEYGQVVSAASSGVVFTLTTAGDPVPSAEDDAYNGCTIRFIMTKGGAAGPDYASEDRLITDYVGSTRTVTIYSALSNSLTDYTVSGSSIQCLIFSPIETRKISEKINLKIKTFSLKSRTGNSAGFSSGSKVLNLLDYTDITPTVPSIEDYLDDKLFLKGGVDGEPFTSSASSSDNVAKNELFGSYNILQGQKGPLTGLYLAWKDGATYRYGSITNHVVKFERRSNGGRGGIRYLYNYLEMDSTFESAWTPIVALNTSIDIQIVNLRLETPFTRNPICKYSSDTQIDMFSVLRFTRDSHQLMIIPRKFKHKKYKISLINISLPNRELSNSKGGYITEYPYVYVKLRSNSSNNNTSSETSFSNNPHNRSADFRVIIDNVVDDTTTSHVALRSMEQELENFSIDDQFNFSVFMPDGSVFNTIENDTSSPYEPKSYLQVSALFSITEM